MDAHNGRDAQTSQCSAHASTVRPPPANSATFTVVRLPIVLRGIANAFDNAIAQWSKKKIPKQTTIMRNPFADGTRPRPLLERVQRTIFSPGCPHEASILAYIERDIRTIGVGI